MRFLALDVDLPEPTEANELRYAARIIAVRLVPHGGAATPVPPKFVSLSDPTTQWTAQRKGPAFFAYSINYLIDTDHGVTVDVEATRSIR